jgi:hypothetical protein
MSVNDAVMRYVAAWNERNPERRRALVAQTWTESGNYVDAQRSASGHQDLDAMIAAAQEQFVGYAVRLVSGIECHHRHLRFSWAAGGTPEAPLYLGGTDFAALGSDGGLESVVGFTDEAPAPSA